MEFQGILNFRLYTFLIKVHKNIFKRKKKQKQKSSQHCASQHKRPIEFLEKFRYKVYARRNKKRTKKFGILRMLLPDGSLD